MLLSIEQALEIWQDSPVLRPFRKINHRDDWGDEQTIGVNLKRINYNFNNENDFGIYLGKHDIGFVVAIKSWDFKITGGEVFTSLEELKTVWEID